MEKTLDTPGEPTHWFGKPREYSI